MASKEYKSKTKFDRCNKIGKGQIRVIIKTNFVELKSLMLQAKFQDLLVLKIFKMSYHIWAVFDMEFINL